MPSTTYQGGRQRAPAAALPTPPRTTTTATTTTTRVGRQRGRGGVCTGCIRTSGWTTPLTYLTMTTCYRGEGEAEAEEGVEVEGQG